MTIALAVVVVVALVIILAQARAGRTRRRSPIGGHLRTHAAAGRDPASRGGGPGGGATDPAAGPAAGPAAALATELADATTRLTEVTAALDAATAARDDATAARDDATAQRDAATAELGAASGRAATAWVQADALRDRVGELERALAGAGGEVTPPLVEVLWALDALARRREARQASAVSTAQPAPVAPAGELVAVLGEEIERLREDAGTPGALHVDLDAPPGPSDGLLVLRSTQSLLAVLARHCDAYDLYLHRFESRVLATFVCEGFDGPDAVADETSELLAALSPVGGRLELDDDGGKLRARLSLPVAVRLPALGGGGVGAAEVSGGGMPPAVAPSTPDV